MQTDDAKQVGCSYRKAVVALTDRGLAYAGGTLLVRMVEDDRGRQGPNLDADGGRLLCLLSIVAGQPVDPAAVLPPIEAAAAHWRRGDKALANLRLVFADLPRAGSVETLRHLSLAADLLDAGSRPSELIKALWPWSASLGKYNPDEPRKPAGVDGAGEWTFADAFAAAKPKPDGRIVVATQRRPTTLAQDIEYAEHRMFGQETIEEDIEHGRPIEPFNQVPLGAGAIDPREELIAAEMKAAIEAAGPGRGPVYGTRVHTELKARIRGLGRDDISAEQSFKDGLPAKYGTKGSVRMDVGIGPARDPQIVLDAKTGGARLTAREVEAYKEHLPSDGRVQVKELR